MILKTLGLPLRTILSILFTLSLLFHLHPIVIGTSSESVFPDRDKEADPILFLHDWAGIAWVWSFMIEFFKTDGWPSDRLFAFDFDDGSNCSVQSNINNAYQIRQWIGEIMNETGSRKVDIVAHGMGGLSSRYYIKNLNGIGTVGDYVSITAPHHGNNDTACGVRGVNDFVLMLNEGDETPGGLLDDTLGIRQDPIFPERTNTGDHITGNINYTSVYVLPDDAQINGSSCPLDGAYNIESDFYSHGQIIRVEPTYNLIISAIGGPYTFNSNNTNNQKQSDQFKPSILNVNKAILVGGSLGLMAIFYISTIGHPHLQTFTKKRRVQRTKRLLKSFTDIFTPQQLGYLAVLGQSKPSESVWTDKVPQKYRADLLPFRYLMHPIRLSIMKLLYIKFSLTSVEIKNELGISWGDYSNHINSLAKKGFVTIQTEFQDTSQIQVVYLEELGRQEYKALIDLLKDFLINAEYDIDIEDTGESI